MHVMRSNVALEVAYEQTTAGLLMIASVDKFILTQNLRKLVKPIVVSKQQRDVDDRLRRQTRNGRAANVFNAHAKARSRSA